MSVMTLLLKYFDEKKTCAVALKTNSQNVETLQQVYAFVL